MVMDMVTDMAANGRPPRPNRIKQAVCATAGLLLALSSGANALSNAMARTAPSAATRAFPPNGMPWQSVATAAFRSDQTGDQDVFASPGPRTMDLARKSYTREPLADSAIAFLARAASQRSATKPIMVLETAHRATRRSTMLSLDLLNAYAQAGREAEGLAVFDELLRRETSAHGVMLERLAAISGDPRIERSMAELLSSNPPWSDQLWRQIAQSPDGMANARALRLALAGAGGRVDPEVDRLLIAGLAGSQRFEDSYRLLEALFPASVPKPGTVHRPHFQTDRGVVPFDWRHVTSGDFGASENQGSLLVSALAGAQGLVSEQLLYLPSRRSSLDWAVSPAHGKTSDGLKLSATCASSGTLLAEMNAAGRKALTNSSCRWVWLRLAVDVPDDGDASDWTVSRIAIQ